MKLTPTQRALCNNLNSRLNTIRVKAARGKCNEVQDDAFLALSDLNKLIRDLTEQPKEFNN
jgi:hypothetical protein